MNAALFKKEKTADQALSPHLPQLLLRRQDVSQVQQCLVAQVLAGCCLCNRRQLLAGIKQNKKDGKNEEVQGQLLLIVIGNMDIN